MMSVMEYHIAPTCTGMFLPLYAARMYVGCVCLLSTSLLLILCLSHDKYPTHCMNTSCISQISVSFSPKLKANVVLYA